MSHQVILETFVGIIMPYTGTSIPIGWVYCRGDTIGNNSSGATYVSEKYRNLFNILKQGAWNGSNTLSRNFDSNHTMRLPDMRGMFLRGLDDNASRDPDASKRFDCCSCCIGDCIGTRQCYAVDCHKHRYCWQGINHNLWKDSGAGYFCGLTANYSNYFIGDSVPTFSGISGVTCCVTEEQRPHNIALDFIIKY